MYPASTAKRGRPAGALRRHEATADHDGSMTLAQIAEELGVTRERVRQIEGEALRKVAKALHDRGLDADDLLD